MTSKLMEDCLGFVSERRPSSLSKQGSMFVIDSFRRHLSYRMRSSLRNTNSDLLVIPGGVTGQLQPLLVTTLRYSVYLW
jgi:hypothetical protein